MSTRYRYGYCNSSGMQMWSKIYDDFDTCYSDYVAAVGCLRDIGINPALMKWRGVFNLDQAALLMSDKNIYADKMYVEVDTD